MTNDNKLKIVTLSHNIKALCYILDKRTFSEHCVASDNFFEIDSYKYPSKTRQTNIGTHNILYSFYNTSNFIFRKVYFG